MDLLIPILLGFIQAALAVLGAFVSLNKIGNKKRVNFMWAFIGLAIIGVGLTIWQAFWARQSIQDSARNALGDEGKPPYVAVISFPNYNKFLITNNSNYPAYGIHIRLHDDNKNSKTKGIIAHEYKYPDIAAHTALVDDEVWCPPDNVAELHFWATISTRTGLATENLILRRTSNNQWMQAIRVMQGQRKLEEQIDSSWPREASGDIRWEQ
jgi:hypothetical protein